MVTEVSWMQFGVNRTRDLKIERTENDDFGIKLNTKIHYHFIISPNLSLPSFNDCRK